MIRFIKILLVIFFFVAVYRLSSPRSYTPLEKSLAFDRLGEEFVLEQKKDKERFLIVSKSTPKKLSGDIPKIFHFILIEPLKEDQEGYVSSWATFHPQWKSKKWDRDALDKVLGKEFLAYTQTLPRPIQSDIISARILHLQGGVVVDPDVECIQPIDDIAASCSFFCGFEPTLFEPLFDRRLHISPSVVGSSKENTIAKRWLEVIAERADKHKKSLLSKKTILYTTVDALGSVVDFALNQNPSSVLVLGPSYFCPINQAHIDEYESLLSEDEKESKIKRWMAYLGIRNRSPFSRPGVDSRAVNHIGGRAS